jgi:hypothetical protein
MKAKLSLLISLLTIVGLVACTAAIPVSSTSTVVPASTTTTTANTAPSASGPIDHVFFDYVEGLNTDTNPVIYSETFDAGAYSEVTSSQKLSEQAPGCGNQPCFNAELNITFEFSFDGVSWIIGRYVGSYLTPARYVRARVELDAYDPRNGEKLSYAYPGSILLFARFSN